MTRDGLIEENLRDGSIKDISHRSRGRPENKEEFVPERERKKTEGEDSKSGKGKRLQMEKIRKSSVRQETVEDTVEVTPEEKVSGYRKKLHRHEKIPDDDNNLNKSHFHHRPWIQKPSIDQSDLKVGYDICTDRSKSHRVKYIYLFQVSYSQSPVELGEHKADQSINSDQNPVSLSPEGFKNQPSVKIIPDIGKYCCLSDYDNTCQAIHNKSLKIISFFHKRSLLSLLIQEYIISLLLSLLFPFNLVIIT